MDKRIALVTLIKNSLSFPIELKLKLLDLLPDFTDEQVEKLGKYLSQEHKYAITNEETLKQYAIEIIKALEQSDNSVLVGSSKPS